MNFKRGDLEQQVKKIPEEVRWCRKCVISNQRPRVIFDENDICSACSNVEYKNTIDWKQREAELITLLDGHRSSCGDWDVIVPSSGGKDSGYVAHKLKYEYGMNPLLVTWSPLSYTEIGLRNFQALSDSGFVCIKLTPNGQAHHALARLSFEELGDAFHVFVLGQLYAPIHIALKFGIRLIFYGENGELEYAGDPAMAHKPYLDIIKKSSRLKGYCKGVTFDELLEHRSLNNTVIITSANYGFKINLFNFVCNMKALRPK